MNLQLPCLALALAATVVSCSSDRHDPVPALATATASCPLHDVPGDVICYRVTVPENPDRPDGRTLDLEVMVLEARADDALPDPLVVIPGGPGQSATRAEGPRNYFAFVFDPLRDERDIVLLAPRGTAGSGELALEPSPDLVFDDLATVVPESWARAARPRLEREAELAMYTTSHVAEDLETIRSALGYGAVNIYGTSYGTRVAQLYAARYPEHVRTLILKAPVPPSAVVPLTYTTGSQGALDSLFALCRRQEECARAYPDIERRFEDLLERLERDPIELTVENPLSGSAAEIRVDDTAFGYVLRNLMMPARGGAIALALIDETADGDLEALSTWLPALRGGYVSGLAGGMTLSVIATEDVPRVDGDALERDADAGFLRGAVGRGMMRATDGWPRGDAPEDLYRFLEGDTPTLLVAGAFDPATPASFAYEIAERLSNARVVVFPGGAHSANNFDGLGGIMEEFVRTADVDGLDLSAARENHPLPLAPRAPADQRPSR